MVFVNYPGKSSRRAPTCLASLALTGLDLPCVLADAQDLGGQVTPYRTILNPDMVTSAITWTPTTGSVHHYDRAPLNPSTLPVTTAAAPCAWPEVYTSTVSYLPSQTESTQSVLGCIPSSTFEDIFPPPPPRRVQFDLQEYSAASPATPVVPKADDDNVDSIVVNLARNRSSLKAYGPAGLLRACLDEMRDAGLIFTRPFAFDRVAPEDSLCQVMDLDLWSSVPTLSSGRQAVEYLGPAIYGLLGQWLTKDISVEIDFAAGWVDDKWTMDDFLMSEMTIAGLLMLYRFLLDKSLVFDKVHIKVDPAMCRVALIGADCAEVDIPSRPFWLSTTDQRYATRDFRYCIDRGLHSAGLPKWTPTSRESAERIIDTVGSTALDLNQLIDVVSICARRARRVNDCKKFLSCDDCRSKFLEKLPVVVRAMGSPTPPDPLDRIMAAVKGAQFTS